MIERKLKMDNELEDSIFLFGARQTGKSTQTPLAYHYHCRANIAM